MEDVCPYCGRVIDSSHDCKDSKTFRTRERENRDREW
jgi:hypothetical protein